MSESVHEFFDEFHKRNRQSYVEKRSKEWSRRKLLKVGAGAAIGTAIASFQLTQGYAVGGNSLAVSSTSPFIVGEFLKCQRFKDASGVIHKVNGFVADSWFQNQGLLPINLIYSSRFLDGSGPNSTLNLNKLTAIAESATSQFPVSLDAEVWDKSRFSPNKPTENGKSICQNLIELVRTFKKINPITQVGLYSELPQNTYDFAVSQSKYDQINPQYAALAHEVDYYSPSLYNYSHDGTSLTSDQSWANSAKYAINQCKAFDHLNNTSKPILAYVTPAWIDSNNKHRYLNEEQMHFRLQKLKEYGAYGCILWVASNAQEENSGQPLALDANQGWFKAAIDFAHVQKSL
jgi:hypothetical protein